MASGELSDLVQQFSELPYHLVQQFSELPYHSSEQQDDLAMELPY